MKPLVSAVRMLWVTSGVVLLSTAPAFVPAGASDFPPCTIEQYSQVQDCRNDCDSVYWDAEYQCSLSSQYNWGYCINEAQIRQGECYGGCQQPCD